jgi:hypothetical protein
VDVVMKVSTEFRVEAPREQTAAKWRKPSVACHVSSLNDEVKVDFRNYQGAYCSTFRSVGT